MDSLKRTWTQIRAALEDMTRAEKTAIIALTLLGLVVVGGFVFWASQPETVAISPMASGRSDQVLSRLRSAGIHAEVEAGQIVVPVDQQDRAIVMLVQGDLLSEDSAAAFDQMVVSQSPWTTNEQGDRAFLIAKQKVLGRILVNIQGVRAAQVVLAEPRDTGFGKTAIRPSASVTVTTVGSRDVKSIVPAIAGLVSGAVAGMKPQDVDIVHANTGQAYNTGEKDDMLANDQIELVYKLEEYHKRKIERQLSYIPSVLVAVNVRTDSIAREITEGWKYDKSQLVLNERTLETEERNVAASGEPGPRSNTGLDISSVNRPGSVRTQNETETAMGERPILEKSHRVLAGHKTQKINVTVNVPRTFFVDLFKRRNPENESEPDDATLQPIVDRQLAMIRAQIEPLIDAESQGLIAAHMIPDVASIGPAPAAVGLDSVMTSGWIGTVGASLLAVFAIGLMAYMVRHATKPESLPSLEELAGVPPTLPAEEDLIGEVEEHEATMEGMELDEEQLKSRRMAEQISEMIKANPGDAGAILGKWVRTND